MLSFFIAQANSGSVVQLLNLRAVADNLMRKGRNRGDLELEDEIFKKRLVDSPARISLAKEVLGAFHSLAAPPNFIWQDINTLMGFHIDAEVVFDAKAKPLGPIKELALLGREQASKEETLPPAKPLPKEAKRVALIVLTFSDCLMGPSHAPLSGQVQLKKKLLEARGYKVLLVRFDELEHSQKSWMKNVKILDAKLRKVLSLD